MVVAVPRERTPDERRVALVPESIRKLAKAGLSVQVEAGAGVSAGFSDDDYREAGTLIEADRAKLWEKADFVVKIHAPLLKTSEGECEVEFCRSGSMLLGGLMPSRYPQVMQKLADRKVSAFSTDCIPRITRAQSMDTLSSQATIAGYKAVILAANELGKIFPMFMTAAGTLMATRVFVIGAGVAGLQAVATAKRLGATVEANDTRAAVKEQVESVGGKFVSVDAAEDAQDARGYAKELSREFQEKQARLIADRCAANDVVITTALIGGVKAPTLITEDMVRRMRPGSVIVDLAADGGGNCAVAEIGKTVVRHGVTIAAPLNLPSQVPMHASLMWSRNLTTFLLEFWKNGKFQLNPDDEIIKGALVVHEGRILHEGTLKALQAS